MNTVAVLAKLKNYQAAIQFESEEDEGAAEHWAEVQSIIDVIEAGGSEAEIVKIADDLCVPL